MIENRVLLLLHLATEFINITMVYVTIFGFPLVNKKWKIVGTITAVVCGHIWILEASNLRDAMGMSFFTMIAVPLFMLSGRRRTFLLLYPFIVIMSSVVSVSVSFLVANLLGVRESVILENSYIGIPCQCAPMLFMMLWGVYRKVKKKEFGQVHLDGKQYVLLYTVVVSEFLMLMPLQDLSENPEIGQIATAVGLPVSVACIVLAVLAVWQGVVVNREIRLQEQNRMLEEFARLQKNYYADIIEKDKELRRFRHDMNAHTSVLQAYCETIRDVNLKNYVDNMVKEATQYEWKVYTGNYSADAILSQNEKKAYEKGIQMKVEGALPNKSKVEDYDLCILLSNLLTNAIEACEQIAEVSKRQIILRVGSYEEKLYIEVKNTISKRVVIENNRLITTKNDKKNHGIGSENVAHTVKKYDGIVNYHCDNEYFTAEVCI